MAGWFGRRDEDEDRIGVGKGISVLYMRFEASGGEWRRVEASGVARYGVI